MKQLPPHTDSGSDALAQSNDAEIEKALPDTRRLASAVHQFPLGDFDTKDGGKINAWEDPALSNTSRHVTLRLEMGDRKVIIIVGETSATALTTTNQKVAPTPVLGKIMLWKGDNWNEALRTSIDGWEPHNHGMTQAHIDELTAYVSSLPAKLHKKDATPLPNISKQVSDGSRRALEDHGGLFSVK